MRGTQILMHRNEKVLTCVFDSRGYVENVLTIHNRKFLPPCIDEGCIIFDLQRWLLTRSLAINRRDIAPLKEFYGTQVFLSETSLSLFDHYWFKEKDSKKTWEEINAFDNWDAQNDEYYLMIAHPEKLTDLSHPNSPNYTIPGRTQRFWYKTNSQIYLLHGNAKEKMDEYKADIKKDIVSVKSYVILSETVYAAEIPRVTKEIERISFEDYYNALDLSDMSKAKSLQMCCEHFNIPNWKDFIFRLCEFDDSTGNESRELSDIGVLRDSNTLEIIGFDKI